MDVKEAIETRRSYRSIVDTEITEEVIEDLATAASLAPSCYNNQPWRYVFVYEEEQLKQVQQSLAEGNAWAKKSPLMVAIFTQKDYDCVVQDKEYYLFDVGMSVNNILLRATELGLATHLMAGFNEEEAKEALDIPEEMKLIALMAVGKQADEIDSDLSPEQQEVEKNRPERLDLEEFMYLNRVD